VTEGIGGGEEGGEEVLKQHENMAKIKDFVW
jgi:hypothetical protein